MSKTVEHASLLSDLLFVPSEMEMKGASEGLSRPDCSVVLKSATSTRRISLSLPVVLRSLEAREVGKHWGGLCGLLRQNGVALHCPLAALDAVAAGAIPLRIGRRFRDAPLDSVELKNSDAFELDLRSGLENQYGWNWPEEITSPKLLAACVSAVRDAAGGDTPIGAVLPLGAAISDLKNCVEADVDYLSLVGAQRGNVDGLMVQGVVQARKVCIDQGREDLPIMIDVPVRQVSDIPKLLALGASVVSMDELVAGAVRRANAKLKQLGTGMLAGIATPTAQAADPLAAVVELFAELKSSLWEQMALCHVGEIADLSRSHLRAQSLSAAQIADVAHLSAAADA